MRHFIVLDDMRNNASTAKFLHRELNHELSRASDQKKYKPIHSDIVCAPSPLEAWSQKEKNLDDFSSLEKYMNQLKKPIILIDWGMPISDNSRPLMNQETPISLNIKRDGLYLFYIFRIKFEIEHCYLWSQFDFRKIETDDLKLYKNIDEKFQGIVEKSWLSKANLTGIELAKKIK